MSPSEVYCLWSYLKDGVLTLGQFSPHLERDQAVVNKVQACVVLEIFYSKFSPILGLFQGLPYYLNIYIIYSQPGLRRVRSYHCDSWQQPSKIYTYIVSIQMDTHKQFPRIVPFCLKQLLTLEEWADVPDGHNTRTCKLAKGHLHEDKWNPRDEQHYQERNQECTCKYIYIKVYNMCERERLID